MGNASLFGSRPTADQVLAGIDLTGKQILVTACDSAVGFAITSALAANGAHVIAAGSTLEAAADAARAVGYHCSPLACDFGDFESIATAGEEIRRRPAPLDAVVAIGGALENGSLRRRYGVEEHFLFNHIGHFALIKEACGSVRDAVGRIVIVSSRAASRRSTLGGIIPDDLDGVFADLDGNENHGPRIYEDLSNFANALYSKELSRRLQPRGVAVNCVNPGVPLGKATVPRASLLRRLMSYAASPFLRNPARAAATISFVAASPDAAGITGEYWENCRVTAGHPLLNDARLSLRLWNTSERIIARHCASEFQALPKAA